MQKAILKFSRNNYINNIKDFLISKKWNGFFVFLFLFVFLFIIFNIFFYKYNSNTAINNNFTFNRFLPSVFNPIITKQMLADSELEYLKNLNQLHNFDLLINNITDNNGNIINNNKLVSYDAYKLLEILNKENYQLYLGTNNQGIDNWSRLNLTIWSNYSMAILAIALQTIISIFIGSYLAIYLNNIYAKSFYKIFQLLGGIPFLLLAILIYSLVNFSYTNNLIVFMFLLMPFYIIFFYEQTNSILQMDFIKSYITSGYKKRDLIFKVLFRRLLMKSLLIFTDYLIIILSTIVVLSFLNVNNINNQLNLGSVLKDALEVWLSNWQFITFLFLINSILLFTIKYLAFNIYQFSQKEEVSYA